MNIPYVISPALPTEVWTHIIRLARDGDRRCGKKLMLVSKQHHAITEPLFYRDIHLGDSRRFLRTIVARPELAVFVRRLSFAYECWTNRTNSSALSFWNENEANDSSSEEEEERTTEDAEAVEDAPDPLYDSDEERTSVACDDADDSEVDDEEIRTLSSDLTAPIWAKARQLGLSQRWITMLGALDRNACIVVILHLLPSLQTLDIDPPGSYRLLWEGFPRVHPPAKRIPLGFQNLETVVIQPWGYPPGGYEIGVALTFLVLPNLKSLTVYNMFVSPYRSRMLKSIMKRLRGTSPVTELRFWDSRMPSSLLMEVAHIPKALQKFEYENGSLTDAEAEISYSAIAEGIRDMRGLEELTLFDQADVFDEEEYGSLDDSLKSLRALRTLRVDLAAFGLRDDPTLKLVQVLPPGITDLTLRYSDEYDGHRLNTDIVLPYIQGQTSLKSLYIRSFHHPEPFLSDVCDTKGISLANTSYD
jgi:hypothetical protein